MGIVHGGVAQLGERLLRMQEVKSSILSVSTKKIRSVRVFFFCSFGGAQGASLEIFDIKCAR